MSKYSLQTYSSRIVKRLLLFCLVASVLTLLSLWPLNWVNAPFIGLYIVCFIYLIYFSAPRTVRLSFDKSGEIDIISSDSISGNIHTRSFYNSYAMALCIEIKPGWQEEVSGKHRKCYRWLVVFADSVAEKEYRLLARLIRQAND